MSTIWVPKCLSTSWKFLHKKVSIKVRTTEERTVECAKKTFVEVNRSQRGSGGSRKHSQQGLMVKCLRSPERLPQEPDRVRNLLKSRLQIWGSRLTPGGAYSLQMLDNYFDYTYRRLTKSKSYSCSTSKRTQVGSEDERYCLLLHSEKFHCFNIMLELLNLNYI